MTQHILIGVGGSGQHVVHAYLRLLTLTSPQAKDVPHVFIFDADATWGPEEGKRNTLIDDIFDLHRFLVSDDKAPPCCEVLKPYKTTSQKDARLPVLGQHIEVTGNVSIAPLAHGFLADDDHEWGNDWDIEISKGMLANPKVGSITLAHKIEGIVSNQGLIDGKSAHVKEQFDELFNILGEGTRVAIVGSNFGGTGSGVIPPLVRLLDNQPRIEAVRAFMCLPSFTIQQDASSGRTSAARAEADVDPKARNSSLGLHEYLDELSGKTYAGVPGLKKSTYAFVQAMEHWPEEKRIDDGNFDQSENRHVLNLVQASAVQAFLGLGEGGAPNGELYSLKTTSAAENRGLFDAASSPHMRFWAGKNDSRQLVDLIADAEA